MRRPHVFIVEDSELVSGALRILFEQTGRRVTTAPTVAEAIHAAAADPPDLMLLDVTLPDGDGLTVVEQLRAGGHSTGIVLALTGHDDVEVAERCTRIGCAGVLLKPVATRDLLAQVAALLD
jgi:DNA-binding response OmpR family regulator